MARKYFSGFTGSAGTLVVTPDEAALFTDGRYFIQAAKELKDSGITLMKMGEPEVPTMTEYVDQKLQQGWTLCFDGRVLTSSKGSELEEIARKHGGQLRFDLDLCDVGMDKAAQFEQDLEYRGFAQGQVHGLAMQVIKTVEERQVGVQEVAEHVE